MRKLRTFTEINQKAGVTLMEVIVGMAIFMLVAIALTGSVIQARKLSTQNILENTAQTAVLGYMEQIKSIAYVELLAIYNDPGQTIPIPTTSGSAIALGKTDIADPLILNQENHKEIVIDIDFDDEGTVVETRTMDLWVTPRMTRNAWAESSYRAIEMRLDYEWEIRGRGTNTERGSDSIVFLRVAVSE